MEYLEMYCEKEDGDDSEHGWDEDEGDDHRNETYECNESWKMPWAEWMTIAKSLKIQDHAQKGIVSFCT